MNEIGQKKISEDECDRTPALKELVSWWGRASSEQILIYNYASLTIHDKGTEHQAQRGDSSENGLANGRKVHPERGGREDP